MRKVVNGMIVVVLLLVIGFCGYRLLPDLKDIKTTKETEQKIVQIIDETTEDDVPFSKDSWNAFKELNDDFVGYLLFDSGIVSQPIVQSYDNDYYLRRNINREYSESGVPFMDFECGAGSDNITIYGHNVYYNDEAMFSPISFLVKQDKVNESPTFKIYFENEVRSYVITDVYHINIKDVMKYSYEKADFASEREFNDWYSIPHNANLIQPMLGAAHYGDHLVTLQTCRRWDDDTHILVLAKEIDRSIY